MMRAFLRSFTAHSYSYATKMIDKNAPSGRVRSSGASVAQAPGPLLSHQLDMGRAAGHGGLIKPVSRDDGFTAGCIHHITSVI